nr:hypothetical protein Itr_chr03CG04370 [Ipomoea trifida]GMC69832.1 hypothetical protein Iba_scaffold61320CG0010 [Ipomoea batatas]GMD13071.1 hypothetical protein Iba_scaffold40538CG0010 [Ipomoea batatas]GMD93534.1 hypothetical protein Iba_chr14fCG8360 [Ipomoea batatas]GME00806.1 hypothetical protein Iba_scaffold55948CG0010 [Ipomoea batatas]
MDLVASLNHGFLRRGDGLGRDHSSSLALDLPCTESPAGPWTLNQPFRQKEPRCMTFPCLMKRARPIEDLPIGHRSSNLNRLGRSCFPINIFFLLRPTLASVTNWRTKTGN